MLTSSHHTCPVCNATTAEIRNPFCEMHASLIFPDAHIHQYMCSECGHGVLQHDIPSEILYNSSVGLPTDHSAGDLRFEFVKAGVDLNEIDGVIVEIGGGPGELAEQARTAVGHSRAVVMDFVDRVSFETLDFVKIDLNHDAAKIPVLLHDRLEEKNLFLLSHVVEHLTDPAELLTQLRQFENSMFYIEVPDFGSSHAVGALKFSLNNLEHLHYFTDRSFIGLSQKAGFQVLAFETQSLPRMPAIRALCKPRKTDVNAIKDYDSHFTHVTHSLEQRILSADPEQEIWVWGLSAFMATALENLGDARRSVSGIFDTRYPQDNYLGIKVQAEPDFVAKTGAPDRSLVICGSTYSAVQKVIRAKAQTAFPNAEFFVVSES